MRPLLLLLLAWPPAQPAVGKLGAEAAADESTLKTAGLRTDAAALLDFFRSRTLSRDQQDACNALFEDLSSNSYTKRVKATEALAKSGYRIKALLARVAKEAPDCEVQRRAQGCLDKLRGDPEPQLAAAAARLVALSKPAGAAAVLLDYLPFAADPPVTDAVLGALTALAVRDGKPEAVFVKALHDKLPLRRAAAAEALCRAGQTQLNSDYLAALKGNGPEARLRVALALFDGRCREAVPELIDLLPRLPAEEVWRVEEALRQAAGDKAPTVTLDRDTPAKKVRDAWSGWWAKNSAALDLGKIDLTPRLLGYTLLARLDPTGTTGRVLEVGPDKRVRWEIDGLRYPVDAEVTGPNRVLIAEFQGGRVSERDFKGKVIWEKQVALPIACQRLPNGHTFVATRRLVFVLDRAGKEVFTYHHQATSISAARRLRDGQTVLVYSGQLTRLDANGKPVKTFAVGLVYPLGGNIDVLPNGHVLVPEYKNDRVVEYDTDGKAVWQARAETPISAVRLPNGNTLLVGMRSPAAVEIDRQGREVWSQTTEGRLWRARRR
jgi:hypothetical protein